MFDNDEFDKRFDQHFKRVSTWGMAVGCLSVLASVALTAVIIWGIVRLVLQFT